MIRRFPPTITFCCTSWMRRGCAGEPGRHRSASWPDEPRYRDHPGGRDGPQSCVLEQVTNGVAVRMAILYLLVSGATETATHPALEVKPKESANASD